jgi:hypothetical protein
MLGDVAGMEEAAEFLTLMQSNHDRSSVASLPECQCQLLGLDHLPAQRPRGRRVRSAAKEAHGHVPDQEDEVVALVEHVEPAVGPALRGALQALLAQGVGATADRPAVVAQLRRGQPHRIAASVRQQPGTEPQALCRQRRVDLPG